MYSVPFSTNNNNGDVNGLPRFASFLQNTDSELNYIFLNLVSAACFTCLFSCVTFSVLMSSFWNHSFELLFLICHYVYNLAFCSILHSNGLLACMTLPLASYLLLRLKM